jgi:hypothetical protein
MRRGRVVRFHTRHAKRRRAPGSIRNPRPAEADGRHARSRPRSLPQPALTSSASWRRCTWASQTSCANVWFRPRGMARNHVAKGAPFRPARSAKPTTKKVILSDCHQVEACEGRTPAGRTATLPHAHRACASTPQVVGVERHARGGQGALTRRAPRRTRRRPTGRPPARRCRASAAACVLASPTVSFTFSVPAAICAEFTRKTCGSEVAERRAPAPSSAASSPPSPPGRAHLKREHVVAGTRGTCARGGDELRADLRVRLGPERVVLRQVPRAGRRASSRRTAPGSTSAVISITAVKGTHGSVMFVT